MKIAQSKQKNKENYYNHIEMKILKRLLMLRLILMIKGMKKKGI